MLQLSTLHWLTHSLSITIIAFLIVLLYKFSRDSLTGLWVRRIYDWYYPWIIKRKGYVFFLDIDDFGDYNKEYGHGAGDEVLRQVAKALRRHCGWKRSFRYGGDEFCGLTPNSDHFHAYRIANNIRLEVERIEIKLEDGRVIRPTATISVATREQHGRMKHCKLIDKDQGKNAVLVSQDGVLKKLTADELAAL